MQASFDFRKNLLKTLDKSVNHEADHGAHNPRADQKDEIRRNGKHDFPFRVEAYPPLPA